MHKNDREGTTKQAKIMLLNIEEILKRDIHRMDIIQGLEKSGVIDRTDYTKNHIITIIDELLHDVTLEVYHYSSIRTLGGFLYKDLRNKILTHSGFQTKFYMHAWIHGTYRTYYTVPTCRSNPDSSAYILCRVFSSGTEVEVYKMEIREGRKCTGSACDKYTTSMIMNLFISRFTKQEYFKMVRGLNLIMCLNDHKFALKLLHLNNLIEICDLTKRDLSLVGKLKAPIRNIFGRYQTSATPTESNADRNEIEEEASKAMKKISEVMDSDTYDFKDEDICAVRRMIDIVGWWWFFSYLEIPKSLNPTKLKYDDKAMPYTLDKVSGMSNLERRGRALHKWEIVPY